MTPAAREIIEEQCDSKIVVSGGAYVSSSMDFAVLRLTTTGVRDTTFSGNGRKTDSISSSDFAYDVAVQADGKIVIGGTTGSTISGGRGDFAVVRFNTDGSLDTTFDSDGKVTTDIFYNDNPRAVAIQGDGKIVLGGHSDSVIFALARLTTAGALDTTFDRDGKLTTDVVGSRQSVVEENETGGAAR